MTRNLARTLTFGLLAAMFSACGATDIGDPPPDKLYAYVTASPGVFAFSINASTGALTMVPGSPIPTGESSTSHTNHPSGRFAYMPNQQPDAPISAFAVDPVSGALELGPGSPYGGSSSPHEVAVDPSGKFVYVLNGDKISAFSINSHTGALARVAGASFAEGITPFGIAVVRIRQAAH